MVNEYEPVQRMLCEHTIDRAAEEYPMDRYLAEHHPSVDWSAFDKRISEDMHEMERLHGLWCRYVAEHYGRECIRLGPEEFYSSPYCFQCLTERLALLPPETDTVEALAEYAHSAWSAWMHYMFGKCRQRGDGSAVIPPELVERWIRQLHTQYADLPEEEKEPDREEARKILAALAG